MSTVKNQSKDPIIIIGMHRSGTSMLTRFLEESGVYLGNSLDINHESHYFIELNEWIFRQTNTTWDNPYNFQFVNESVLENIIRVCRYHMHSAKKVRYLGLRKAINYSSLKNLDFVWGWKDPRNSITLPIWKSIFPNAKVIHIYRNPIDVADSLKKREIQLEMNFKQNLKTSIKEKILFSNNVGYSFSIRTTEIEEGVKIWKEYMGYIDKYVNRYNDVFNIQYENFLDNPTDILKNLSSYLNIELSDELIADIVKQADPTRKYGFTRDRTLKELYIKEYKHDIILKKYGYGDII
jgi:hypothetical protein